jgi:molybdopterin/thiamine biosynthesis adenylyltransferase/rhodanese-related sulfurtransferase
VENQDLSALPALTAAEYRRYSRHMVIPEFGLAGQQRLKGAKVLVIGAGGLGAPLLLYLAAAGVGTLGIVDFDSIEESNLQRQVLFTTADLGQPKAEVTAARLRALNPHCQVQVYAQRLGVDNALALVQDYHIIADATDNFATRYLINDACVLADKPLVYGSIYRFEGQVSVFNVLQADGRRSPHYRDVFPVPGAAPNCAESGVLGTLPGIIGTWQANEVIKLITGLGEPLAGKLLLFDALTNETRLIKYRHRPETAPVRALSLNPDLTCNITEPNNLSEKTMKEVTVQELKALFDNNADFQLIDVREPHEYQIANLGGELIPLGQVDAQADKIARDKQVVVHCRSGARSGNAIQFLEQKYGIQNLYNLKGGILAWSDEIDPSVPKY